MKLSTERILTTHVGSLPRSAEVVELLYKKDNGEPYDAAAFDAAIAAGVAEAVAKQVAAGVDIVSDGETSKVGYSTYVKDRLSGIRGPPSAAAASRSRAVPGAPRGDGAHAGQAGVQARRLRRRRSSSSIARRCRRTSPTCARQLAAHDGAVEAFMNAASPGVISAFQSNHYYASHEAYVDAIVAAMKPEYDAIVAAGFVLQLDCPDLAMARHTGFQELSESEFLERAEYQVEALNHAVRDIPADRMRMHICWGNYEGPHDHDIALEKILAIVLKAKPAGILFEAANPRHRHEWAVWRDARSCRRTRC